MLAIWCLIKRNRRIKTSFRLSSRRGSGGYAWRNPLITTGRPLHSGRGDGRGRYDPMNEVVLVFRKLAFRYYLFFGACDLVLFHMVRYNFPPLHYGKSLTMTLKMKSQISSTKSQINSNFKIEITKTQ